MIQDDHAVSGCGSCGARLRDARLEAGLTQEDVAGRLKMPARVVRALEADDWSPLGAPVFVRGQLRSYARLLKVDIEPALRASPIQPVAPPELVSHAHTSRFRVMAEHLTRRAVYVVLTVAIALPVWLQTRPQPSEGLSVASLDVPAPSVQPAASGAPTPRSAVPVERTPIIASMAALPARKAPPPGAADAAALSLRFTDDSWVQVFSRDGQALAQGMMQAGQRLSYDTGQVGRVVLGNSAAVEVQRGGELLDFTPFIRANVARFTLSSDGSPAPVSD